MPTGSISRGSEPASELGAGGGAGSAKDSGVRKETGRGSVVQSAAVVCAETPGLAIGTENSALVEIRCVRIPFFTIVCRGIFDILCKNLGVHELGDVGAKNAS